MKDFPDIKDMPTVAIAGFPNVGKSSLLKILTTATPEIASYAFTTKKLNIGYMKTDKGDIQLIDAPGSLNRKNMNWIEKQAHLAIEHLADRVIFMIDPTGISGYTINKQLELYKSIKSKIHSVAISKMDLIEETLLEKILSELKKTIKKKIIPYSATTFTNIEDIKSAIQYA